MRTSNVLSRGIAFAVSCLVFLAFNNNAHSELNIKKISLKTKKEALRVCPTCPNTLTAPTISTWGNGCTPGCSPATFTLAFKAGNPTNCAASNCGGNSCSRCTTITITNITSPGDGCTIKKLAIQGPTGQCFSVCDATNTFN